MRCPRCQARPSADVFAVLIRSKEPPLAAREDVDALIFWNPLSIWPISDPRAVTLRDITPLCPDGVEKRSV